MIRFPIRSAIVALAALLTPACSGGSSLPDYGAVPDFRLTEAHGRSITRQDLAAKVWIADFIFTRCSGACPMMTGQMYQLQKAFAGSDGIMLVSITVDPEHDTPAVLSRYAEETSADVRRWLFLTGGLEAINDLALKGFHLAADQDPKGDDPAAVTHSQKLVLVDGSGRIRGYYNGTEDAQIERLKADALTLSKAG